MTIFYYLIATPSNRLWIKLSLISNTHRPEWSIKAFDSTGEECNELELTFPVLVYDIEKKTYGCLHVIDGYQVVLYPVITSFEEPRLEKGTIYSTTENKWVTALDNNLSQYHPKKIFQNFPLNDAYTALQKMLIEQESSINAEISKLDLIKQKEQLGFEMISLSKQWATMLERDFWLFWDQIAIEGISTAQEFGAMILVLLEKGVAAQAIIDSGLPGNFYLMNTSNSADIEITYQALEEIRQEGGMDKRQELGTFLQLCTSSMLGYPGISETLMGSSLPKPFLAHTQVLRLPSNAVKPTFVGKRVICLQENGHFVVAYWSINNVVQSRSLPKSYLGHRLEQLSPNTEEFILELTSRYYCNLAIAPAEITSKNLAVLFSHLINQNVEDIPLNKRNWQEFALIANSKTLLPQKREQLQVALAEFYLDLVLSGTEGDFFCNQVKKTIDLNLLNHWVHPKITEHANNLHKLYSTFLGELTRDTWIGIRDVYQKERLKINKLHELFGLNEVLVPLTLDELQAKLLKQCMPKLAWSKSEEITKTLSCALDVFLFETDNGNYTEEEKTSPRVKLLILYARELTAGGDNAFFEEPITPRINQLALLNENNKATRLSNRLYINWLFKKIVPMLLMSFNENKNKVVSVIVDQFLNDHFKEAQYPLLLTLMSLVDSDIYSYAQCTEPTLLQWSDFILDDEQKELDITKIIAFCDEVTVCQFIYYWLENSNAFNEIFWKSLVKASRDELEDLFNVIILDSDARQLLLKKLKSQADFWNFLITKEPSQFANFFNGLKAWTSLQEYTDWKPFLNYRIRLISLCQNPNLLPIMVSIFNQVDAEGNTFWDYLATETYIENFAEVYTILMRASEENDREAISNCIRMQNAARPCAFDTMLQRISLNNIGLIISTVVKPTDLPQMIPVLEKFLMEQGKAFWQAMMFDPTLFDNDSFMAVVEHLYQDPKHHFLMVESFSKYYKNSWSWGNRESARSYARIMDLLYCAKSAPRFNCDRHGIEPQRQRELIQFLNFISENVNYQSSLMALFSKKDLWGNNGWGDYYGYPLLDSGNISYILENWIKINNMTGNAKKALLPASIYTCSINYENFTTVLEQALKQALNIGNLSWIAVLLKIYEVNQTHFFVPMLLRLRNEGNIIQFKYLLKAYVCFKLAQNDPLFKSFKNVYLLNIISPEELHAVYNELLSEVGDRMLAHCIRLAFNAPSDFVIAVRAELKRRYIDNGACLSSHITEALQEQIEHVTKAEGLILFYHKVIVHVCTQWRKNPKLYQDKLAYIADTIFSESLKNENLAVMAQSSLSHLLEKNSKLAEYRTTFFTYGMPKSQQLVSLAEKELYGSKNKLLSDAASFINKKLMGREVFKTLLAVSLTNRFTTQVLAGIPLSQEEINTEVWRRVLIHGCFNSTLQSVYGPPSDKNKNQIKTYQCIAKYVRNRKGDQPYDEDCLIRDLQKIGSNEKPSMMGLFSLGIKQRITEDLKQLSVVLNK